MIEKRIKQLQEIAKPLNLKTRMQYAKDKGISPQAVFQNRNLKVVELFGVKFIADV